MHQNNAWLLSLYALNQHLITKTIKTHDVCETTGCKHNTHIEIPPHLIGLSSLS